MALLTFITSTNGLTVIFVGFVIAYLYMTRKFTYWKSRGVKEIPPWAFFGNFAQCLLMRKSPGRFMQDLYDASKGEAFIGYYILDRPHLMVRDPELIRHVLIKDFQDFPNRLVSASDEDTMGNSNLFLKKGHAWRLMRQTVSKFFTSGKMKKVFERMFDVTDDFDQYLVSLGLGDKGTTIDITETCFKFTTDLIGVTTYGIKLNALNQPTSNIFRKHGGIIFGESCARHFQFLSMFFMPQFLKPLGIHFFTKESSDFLKHTFLNVLKEKKELGNGKSDFIDLLMDLKSEELSSDEKTCDFIDEELIAQAAIFFSAGYGTTAITLMFALYELAKNPSVQTKLREEILKDMDETNGKLTYNSVSTLPFLDAVTTETLRIYPTVTFLDRMSDRQYRFPGTKLTIDKNTPVSIPLRAIHMDPKYFPNPNAFEPDRFSMENKNNIRHFTYFPFGDGPHMCIGMRLGLMVTKFALSHIISKYEVRCCEETANPMEFSNFSTFLAVKSNIKLDVRPIV